MDAKKILEFIDNNEIQFEEVNHGDEKIKELYRFDQPLSENGGLKFLAASFWRMLSDNTSTILNVSSVNLIVTIGYFFLSRDEDHFLLSCLGVAITYYKFFHSSFLESIGEKVGINCSKEYGAKLYQSMINTFYTGIAI